MIRKQVADMLCYMQNVSYEALMNMPVQDRNLIAKAHNKKIEKQKKQ